MLVMPLEGDNLATKLHEQVCKAALSQQLPEKTCLYMRTSLLASLCHVSPIAWMQLCGHVGMVLSKGWRPSWQQVVQLSLDLASAVAAVHAAGILHRDIKASNVMLGAAVRMSLSDKLGGFHLDISLENIFGKLSPPVALTGAHTISINLRHVC